MDDWLRRLGSALLSGFEILLALAVWILLDIQAGVESGAYDRGAAGGFAIGFLAFWFSSSVTFGLVVFVHAVVRANHTVRAHGLESVRDPAVRVAAELLLSAAILAELLGGGIPSGSFDLLLGASAVVALGLVVHVAADVVQLARELALGG